MKTHNTAPYLYWHDELFTIKNQPEKQIQVVTLVAMPDGQYISNNVPKDSR